MIPNTSITPLVHDEAPTDSAGSESGAQVATPLPEQEVQQRGSVLLPLPAELRLMVYDHLLDSLSSNNFPVLFIDAHRIGTVCRQLRYEFYTRFLNRNNLLLDLKMYESFINAYYPPASPDVMNNYLAKIKFTLEFGGAFYFFRINSVSQGRTVDLRALIMLLRNSPSVSVELNMWTRWVCKHEALEAFLQYARTDPTWVVTPLIGALNLRLREAQIGLTWTDDDTYWIIDVHLKRNLRYVYEQMGLLAYLEQRSTEGRDGITFFVVWEEKELEESTLCKTPSRLSRSIKSCFARLGKPKTYRCKCNFCS